MSAAPENAPAAKTATKTAAAKTAGPAAATAAAERAESRKPVILAVDDDPQVLRAVRRDLRSAYGDRYRVLGASSAADALKILDSLDERGHDPALFLVDQRMPDVTGVEFLLEAVSRFPDARRVLLTAYAETDAAITAINRVRLDYYLLKPWDPPHERLFPVLDDLLSDWLATYRPAYDGIIVAGHLVSPGTHAVRDFFTRNGQPFRFLNVERDPEALTLIAAQPDAALPLVRFPDGAVLSAPTDTQLAQRLGLATTASRPHYECVIVGAGPAGLAAGVYSASEGLSTLMLDSRAPGGQAGTSSLIENYLGFPSGLSGGDLTRRATIQASRFGAEILHPVEVTSLTRDDPAKILTLADGTEISAETVLLATGVSYNRLEAPGADRFEGAGLYYGAATTESSACISQHVFIVGGANSAGQAAVHFAKYAARVTILVRAQSLDASMSRYLIDEIDRTPNIEVRVRTTVVRLDGDEHLEKLTLHNADTGEDTEVPARFMFTFIGARPHTDWLSGVVERDEYGFVLTGSDLISNGGELPAEWSLERAPYPLETSVPGVFAAGDVRAHSVKRVASGVGEGAMAVSLIHRYRSMG
ncbi:MULTISPECIES: FAD-dependent oxidoreductase [Streptomyces]|uniref:FAD-dependent oxidoreductase n=1 Tax=Streptomyces TaxID=1883 RepID=UPI00017EA3BC|nr:MULTISPECIES: FAD-dependent oxidoreductase [Streptomyces]EDX23413.1 thioredoxin reductase carring response regulator receiver domain containing protein [Streptomyces sp. Mg1]RPK38604.1 Thioredoxin reductase [Streptomyces sp. ADI91-18]WBY19259.1 FAD-dependent oxidoreductase [Streptomyces goshikiensis]WSY00922.1 FAD-dependent oxidoreductase [Streptomyces goshikiensis]